MKNDNNKGLSDAMKHAHLGITFIIMVGVFLTGGFFLDKWLGTTPWLFVFSVFPGLSAGIYLLYKELIAKNDEKSGKS